MRVLVAGATGQVARAAAAAFAAAGHAVTALGRPALDLTDRATIGAALASRPELVINAAACTAVDRAEDEPALARAVNATGAGWLAEAAAARGAALIHLSTDYVFDGTKGAPYAETDAPNPLGVYGATKLEGERLVMAAHPHAAVIRTAWVCSAEGGNFVKTMLRLAAERAELRVVADQLGAPSFCDDLAQAMLGMAPRLVAGEGYGLFHLTGAPHTTWHGFAEAILDGAARRGHPRPRLAAITTADYPTKARRPADGRLDCARIGAVHGIAPADWRVSLGRCLDRLLGPVREDDR
jgi:dTDP-4-dehydrorhamnose reductase